MSFTIYPISQINEALGIEGHSISFDDIEIPEDAVWEWGGTSDASREGAREYMTNRVVSEETRQKLSDYWKGKHQPHLQKSNYTKHHCPIHDKWMNIGNLMRYHKHCIS